MSVWKKMCYRLKSGWCYSKISLCLQGIQTFYETAVKCFHSFLCQMVCIVKTAVVEMQNFIKINKFAVRRHCLVELIDVVEPLINGFGQWRYNEYVGDLSFFHYPDTIAEST